MQSDGYGQVRKGDNDGQFELLDKDADQTRLKDISVEEHEEDDYDVEKQTYVLHSEKKGT